MFHWISIRMAAGYDDEDFRELVNHLNGMRSVAEAQVVEATLSVLCDACNGTTTGSFCDAHRWHGSS